MRTLFMFAALLTGAPAVMHAQGSCPAARTALVLSGGGAKGLAHVGVLQVLDSLGFIPDFIVGTSMGSVIGAMYAVGFTGNEIDSIVRHAPGGSLLQSFEPVAPRALGTLQPMISFAQGDGVSGLQTNALNERDVNALLDSKLFLGNLRARGDFDSLPIPFRAVATNLGTRTPVVLSRGDLPRAVRASIAIPIVFSPEYINGQYLADGGLSANIPIGIARELGAVRVIVSDVSAPLPDSTRFISSGTVGVRMMDYLFEQPLAELGPEDIFLKQPVSEFGSLDFSTDKELALLKIGRETADSVFAGVSCLSPARGDKPRNFRRLPRSVGAITIEGKGNPAQGVMHDLALHAHDSIPYGELDERVNRIGETELIDAVWLYPSGESDTVAFTPVVRLSPRLWAGGGFAYDNALGGALWLGAIYQDLLHLGLETTSMLRLGGNRDELALAMRKNLRFRWRLLAPTAQLQLASEKVPVYQQDTEQLAIKVDEVIGFVGIERQFSRGWRLGVGVEGRIWEDPSDTTARAGGGRLRLQRFAGFDQSQYLLEGLYTSSYQRALAEAKVLLSLRRVGVRGLFRAGLGNDLPLQLTFPLGGSEGFPGIRPSQLRGDREFSAQTEFWYRVVGPVEIQLTLGAGQIYFHGEAPSGPGTFYESEDWLFGARAGLGAETPVGPVKVGFGWASGGRDALFVRMFRWF